MYKTKTTIYSYNTSIYDTITCLYRRLIIFWARPLRPQKHADWKQLPCGTLFPYKANADSQSMQSRRPGQCHSVGSLRTRTVVIHGKVAIDFTVDPHQCAYIARNLCIVA